MKNLKGKTAVVTGGASGIGFAMADRFAREGMNLAIVDIEAEPLEIAAEKFRSQGARVSTHCVDVSNADRMDALGASVIEEFGSLHILCNNAGVAQGGPMWELSTADWEFAMRPNLWGVIHGIRVFGKYLVAQDEGHIVNTASMAGLVNVPGLGPYNVTKAAVVALSETLYHELQAQGSNVGVSALCPGFVSTRIYESERNRPDDLPSRPDVATPEELEAREAGLAFIMANAMPAERVADIVLEAVLNQRFYVFTHASTGSVVEQRMRNIVAGENPDAPDGGFEVFGK